MILECLGASREVGRSSFMLHTDHRIMLDYGVKIHDPQGGPTHPLESGRPPHFALISHAHLDHSGFVPYFYTKNKHQWYATPPTYDFADLLWRDSMKIMGPDLPWKKKHYKKALRSWSSISLKRPLNLGLTSMHFTDAGHIPGAVITEIEYKNKTLVYTGDFKMGETRMHKGATPVKDVDYLVMESTYAQKKHPDRKQSEKELVETLRRTVDEGGNLILPSFALGRTQEIISVIRKHDKNIPIFLDGMGKEMTRIFLSHPRYIKEPGFFKKAVKSVNFVEDIKGKKEASSTPSAIVTTAGMMNGGPVLNYLFHTSPNSRILFTGYCVEGTNGWKLQTKGYITKDEVDLTVDLPVDYVDFSAHAGRKDLLEFVKKANPEKIILVHGDHPLEFAKELREDFGYDAVAPEIGKKFVLGE